MLDNKNNLHTTYLNSAGAIAYISVQDEKTKECGIGSAFHIGTGLFVTAKHVVENKTIIEVASTMSALEVIEKENLSKKVESYCEPRVFKIIVEPRFSSGNDSLDVAVF